LACSAAAQSLRIYVIDVEQGASTLLVSPGGHTLLVDSGKNGHGTRVRAVMMQAGVSQIDHFVLTHYHEDHMGGIDDLITSHGVTVVNAYDRGEKNNLEPSVLTDTYGDYDTRVGHGAQQLDPGETIPLDPAMTVTCVASNNRVIGESSASVGGLEENDLSVGLRIEFGNFRYFVGGDMHSTTENKLAARDLVLDVDLYQADHHGSHTSSSPTFMQDLNPSVVVISNGNRADYNHPRQVTLNTFASLTPSPAVFQTNKYFKGPPGGNVIDAHIADPQTTDIDGTILITVDPSTGNQVITYGSTTHTVPIKPRSGGGIAGGGGTGGSTGTGPSGLVIASLIPSPIGNDALLESVTLLNKGTTTIPLTGWALRDADGNEMPLSGLIFGGQTLSFPRNNAAITLNNGGDTVTLFAPGNQPRDSFTYTGSSEGVQITTGH